MRAGLIPSRMLQEKRIAYERAHSNANNNDDATQSGILKPSLFHLALLVFKLSFLYAS